MNKRRKINIRLSIMSLTFAIISFISVTLAWFAYSGLSKIETEVAVKSWYIEFTKGTEVVSKNITISVDNVKPGMEPKIEEIIINNKGDSDASVKYKISSVKILNEKELIDSETTSSDFIEDQIAHEYPFHINMGLNKNYVLSKGTENKFKISVSWPLDSGNDELDSLWGNKAYQYQVETNNSAPLIKLEISLIAEQIIDSDNNEPDHNFDLGKLILYDVKNNTTCNSISETCLKTHVIDTKNKIKDTTVTLLPSFENNYSTGSFSEIDTLYQNITSNWQATTRNLTTEDILKVISTDLDNTVMQREGLSDNVLGKVDYGDRASKTIENNINNASYIFKNNSFLYLASNECYWLKNHDNDTYAFSLQKIDNETSHIFKNLKTNSCKNIPVIIANKDKLNIGN